MLQIIGLVMCFYVMARGMEMYTRATGVTMGMMGVLTAGVGALGFVLLLVSGAATGLK